MKNLAIILLLLFSGILTIKAQDKNELLYDAIVKKDIPAVSKLLNVDHANSSYVRSSSRFNKTSVLIAACKTGDSVIVRMLIDKGAELEFKDVPFGRTALMYAVAANKATVVDLLLAEGANVNATDGKGYTVLTAAKDSGDEDMKTLIEDKIEELKLKEAGEKKQ